MSEAPAKREFTDDELAQLLERHWQATRPVSELPGWLPLAMRLLPWTLLAATAINGLIGIVAMLTPLLAAGVGSGLAEPIYTAYSFICPQRPSHTFFLAGHPMAFEQRDLSMHLGFALAGLLYLWVDALRRPLPHWLLAAGVAPMLIDVALSTLGWLPATAFWPERRCTSPGPGRGASLRNRRRGGSLKWIRRAATRERTHLNELARSRADLHRFSLDLSI